MCQGRCDRGEVRQLCDMFDNGLVHPSRARPWTIVSQVGNKDDRAACTIRRFIEPTASPTCLTTGAPSVPPNQRRQHTCHNSPAVWKTKRRNYRKVTRHSRIHMPANSWISSFHEILAYWMLFSLHKGCLCIIIVCFIPRPGRQILILACTSSECSSLTAAHGYSRLAHG